LKEVAVAVRLELLGAATDGAGLGPVMAAHLRLRGTGGPVDIAVDRGLSLLFEKHPAKSERGHLLLFAPVRCLNAHLGQLVCFLSPCPPLVQIRFKPPNRC
jgi:hypothetical protein